MKEYKVLNLLNNDAEMTSLMINEWAGQGWTVVNSHAYFQGKGFFKPKLRVLTVLLVREVKKGE